MSSHAGQLFICCPVYAINTCSPIEFSAVGVFGEQVEKSFSRHEPGLGIGHFSSAYFSKPFYRIRFIAFENQTRPACISAADKDPDKPLIIYGYGCIVMRVVHAHLVIHNGRLGNLFFLVIKIGDGNQQVFFIVSTCCTIHKKCSLGSFAIYRHRNMIGCIGSQPS